MGWSGAILYNGLAQWSSFFHHSFCVCVCVRGWLFDQRLLIQTWIANVTWNRLCRFHSLMLYEASPSPLAYLHVEMLVSMHFCFAATSAASNVSFFSFFSATQWSKDKACLCSICGHCMCVLERVCVAGSESEVGLRSKSAGAHLLLWGIPQYGPHL